MRHVTHANTSRRVGHTSHTSNAAFHSSCTSVTHMNKSCDTHEWVMLHTWMSHVTRMNRLCHTQINASCHISEYVMSRKLRHTHQTQLSTAPAQVWHTYKWVMLHIRLTHSYVCQTYECVMSHKWIRHVAPITSHTSNAAFHSSCTNVTHIWMSRITHMNASCYPCE